MNLISKSVFCAFLKPISNEHGATLIYVLSSFLIISFIGGSMIKMSHYEARASSDYSSASTAISAARSGLLATASFFEANGDSIVKLLNKYVEKPKVYPILGKLKKNKLISIDAMHSFATELISFDKANFNIHIKSYGFGKGGSRKSVDGIFNLSGLEYKDSTQNNDSTKNDWEYENVIFAECNVIIRGPMDVDGNVYFGSSVSFGANSSGSIFNGRFRTQAHSNNGMLFQGTYTFNGPAYFGTKVLSDGGLQFNLNNKSGFENAVRLWGGLSFFDMQDISYWNDTPQGPGYYVADIDMHNNVLAHNGTYKFNGNVKTINYVEQDVGMDIDIPAAMGMKPSECGIDVHVNSIPSNLIQKWTNVEHTNGMSPGHKELDGGLANAIWKDAVMNGKDWNGFAVVEQDDQLLFVDGVEDFMGKLIIIIPSGRVLRPTSVAKSFSHTSAANLTLIVRSGGSIQNIGGWDYYRGLMYCEDGGNLTIGGAGNETDNVHGALYAKPSATMNWYPQYTGNAFFTFDHKVLEELDYNGFLEKTGCGDDKDDDNDDGKQDVSGELSLIVPGSGIESNLRGMHF